MPLFKTYSSFDKIEILIYKWILPRVEILANLKFKTFFMFEEVLVNHQRVELNECWWIYMFEEICEISVNS
jgi:hypothetical protein